MIQIGIMYLLSNFPRKWDVWWICHQLLTVHSSISVVLVFKMELYPFVMSVLSPQGYISQHFETASFSQESMFHKLL